jgi:hypothetical protein
MIGGVLFAAVEVSDNQVTLPDKVVVTDHDTCNGR